MKTEQREPTRGEQERIWELISDEGASPKNIVERMVQAGYSRKWSWAAVDYVIEQASEPIDANVGGDSAAYESDYNFDYSTSMGYCPREWI